MSEETRKEYKPLENATVWILDRNSTDSISGTRGTLVLVAEPETIDFPTAFSTIEPPFDVLYPAIPPGEYWCEKYPSPTHGPTWLVKDVPGREYIEFHSMNWWKNPINSNLETLGCIGLGRGTMKYQDIWGISNSKEAMRRFFELTYKHEKLFLVVENNFKEKNV